MTKTPAAPETIHSFPTSAEAWAFMHECDAAGRLAGFLTAPFTVRVIEKPAQEDGRVICPVCGSSVLADNFNGSYCNRCNGQRDAQ